MPLGHVSLSTGKLHFEQMRDFYTAVLAPLGYAIVMQKEGVFAGFSPKYGAPDFWLHGDGDTSPAFDQAKDKVRERKGKVHVAFDVSSKQVVRNWYENALKAGGVCNGKPGERDYVKGYYAAFIIDPLGNNIEAMYYNPWWLRLVKASPMILGAALGATAVSAATSGYFSW